MLTSNKYGNAYIISEKDSNVSALITLSNSITLGTVGKIAKVENQEVRIKNWGANNNLPALRENLLSTSDTAPALISTKRNMTMGLDIFLYEKRIENGQAVIYEVLQEDEPLIDDFFKKTKIKKYLRKAGFELFLQGNVFTDFISATVGGGGNKIAKIACIESKFIRAGEMSSEGDIKKYYWRGDAWTKREENVIFDTREIEAYDEENIMQSDFVYHATADGFSDDYYGIPEWEGSYSWVNILNIITTFHKSNLEKGSVIRAHIEIPEGYFGSVDTTLSEEEQKNQLNTLKSKKDEFLNTLDSYFAGAGQVGRKLVTDTFFDELSRTFVGIKITPIKLELNDEALLQLYKNGVSAMLSSFQVHPALGNIQIPNELSSGADLRNAYLLWLAIHATTNRDILLEPLYIAKERNGWNPKIHFGFRDLVITTLDNSKTGTTTQ